MSKNKEQSLTLFNQGVEALQRLFPDIPAIYACPLCLRGFPATSMDVLTKEHVPPKSLKGRRLVLTCLDCNGRAGGKDGVDTHARRGEDQLDLLSRSLEGSRRIRFGVGDTLMNASIQYIDGHFEIIGAPGPPGSGEGVMDLFLQMHQDQTFRKPIKVSFPYGQFRQSFQEISWLRAGYLAAFAALGYSYVLGESLKSVRDQIACPESEIIEDFHMWIATKRPFQPPAIFFVQNPEWVQGIAISMGYHLILLPVMGNDAEFYKRMRNLDRKELQKMSGSPLEWPTKPRFELDFSPRGEVFQTICRLYGSRAEPTI